MSEGPQASRGAVTVVASNATLGNGHSFDAPESVVFNKGYTRMYVSDAKEELRWARRGREHREPGERSGGWDCLPLPSSSSVRRAGEADWLAFDAQSNLYMTNENPSQGVMRIDESTGAFCNRRLSPTSPCLL